MNDTTLLVEVVKVLHLMPVDIIDEGVIEWDKDSFKVNLFDSLLNIPLILTVYGNLALIPLTCRLLNVDLDAELILYPLDL